MQCRNVKFDFGEKMKDYAASQGEELMIKAVCSAAAEDEAGEWDVCLVGPQLMHAVDEIAEAVEVPTEAVDMRTYAMADGEGALKQAKALLENNRRINLWRQFIMKLNRNRLRRWF